MNISYSRYAVQPVDRDLERLHAELRALPTPDARPEPARRERRSRISWLRLVHHPRARHA